MSSYEAIDYSLRPAKHVERRMIVELAGRLSEFGSVRDYQYVGFGSTHFADFSLFHRVLGIKHMTSIEIDEENRARFEFNKPYELIRLEFGPSSRVLGELPWDRRAIVWLDYDGKISASVVGDVEFLAGELQPGSLLIVSVNCHTGRLEEDLSGLRNRMGETSVPFGLKASDLEGWGLAKVSRSLLVEAVSRAVAARNMRTPNHITFKPLLNVTYKDGARMLTFGGIIHDDGQAAHFAKCQFDQLPFVRTGADPCHVRVPPLTLKEIRHLNEQLPGTVLPSAPMVSTEDIDAYKDIYRYFPRFVEADL